MLGLARIAAAPVADEARLAFWAFSATHVTHYALIYVLLPYLPHFSKCLSTEHLNGQSHDGDAGRSLGNELVRRKPEWAH